MIKENDEEFFKSICKKYIDTMSKEMLLEADNKKILHIFIEDEYIECLLIIRRIRAGQ